MAHPDALLAISARLSAAQKSTIINRFTALNPHWGGAQVPDILDGLCEIDSDLDQTEPFLEAHPGLPPEAGIAMRALIWAADPLTIEAVSALLGQEAS